MKKVLMCLGFLTSMMFAEQTCSVKVCSKNERITINPLKLMHDKVNESCFDAIVPKAKAKVGTVLASESRFYEGNPTKKFVTKIKKINYCK